MSKLKVLTSVVVVGLIAGGAFYYYRPMAEKPAPTVSEASTNRVLVFTAPPRESAADGELVYKPIADYLSKVTGKKVVYKHPPTWGVYRTEMLNDAYDIVFDGPHFVDYRIQKLGHNVLAKIPEPLQFAIIVPHGSSIDSAAALAGRTFCSQSPPNLGALVALSQYDDPARQPVLVPTKGWKNIYQNVLAGQCAGGVMAVANLRKFDKTGATKVVFQSKGLPNQAFSAGTRVSPADQAKIAAALTSADAAGPTAKLRARFNVGDRLVAANNAEYAGIGQLLRNEFGFESIASSKSVASK